MPIILSMIIPAPYQWAPESIKNYVESRRVETLKELTEINTKMEIQQDSGQQS